MKAQRFGSLLVAVREIERPPLALLSKAARLAARFGSRLELLHVIALPYVAPGVGLDGKNIRDSVIAQQTVKLERVAKRLRKADIEVNCSVVWDFPAADAIVRHALKSKPDIVLAESHHHNKVARWFVAHTDWELIRICPFPLWLVKAPRLADNLRILAAIDPFHTHSKPAALDDELLRMAELIAGDAGRVGVGHVFPQPITMVASGMGEPIWVSAPAQEQKRTKQRVSLAVQTIADRYSIAKSDRIAIAGDAVTELPTIVKRWRANLLVMGAVSRSALQRIFIGHTAERVIDGAHCDVLIVKPNSFKTPVNRRQNVPIVPVPPI